MELRDFLSSNLANTEGEVTITGFVGRSSSFEVTVNDKLVFSKLQLGGFPKHNDVLQAVQEAQKGLEPVKIDDSESPGCTIL